MKKNLIVFVLVIVSLNFVQAQNSALVHIQGKVQSMGDDPKVQCFSFSGEKMKYVRAQETNIQEDGSFQLEFPFEKANLYLLKVGGERQAILAIDQAEKIEITVDLKNKKQAFMVQGSSGTDKFKNFKKAMETLQIQHFAELKAKAEKVVASGDEKQMAALEKEKEEKLAEFLVDLMAEIERMGTSVATYRAINFLDMNKNFDFIEKIGSKFQSQKPELEVSKALDKMIQEAKRIAIGATAPDFTLNDLKGNTVELKNYRGKYVYVDFWASWCLACRIENPKLVSVYEKYHKQGLEFLGVSQDEDLEAWKKAIAKDALIWPQLLEEKQAISKLYGVSNLPSNYLLDREGKIIAKNLNADTLAKQLAQLFDGK